MNVIKLNDKELNLVENTISLSDSTLSFSIETTDTIETVEKDFNEVGDKLVVYNKEVKEKVGVYKGYNRLKYIKKNVDDNNVEVCLEKKPIEDRIKELENAVDDLVLASLEEV